jgi:hypothetical protein
MKNLGVLDFLDAAKRDGRIASAGFSFHGDIATFKEIIDAYNWQFCQIQYNYLDEQIQAGTEGLRYAAGKKLAVMIMEPLRGGNLARTVPPGVQKIWDESPVKRSAAGWGLRWAWNHPEVTVVLSGMNDEADIDENIRIASAALPGSLSPEDLGLVGRVRDTYRQMMKVGCTGCSYCMPCPAGVNIPECFAAYNNFNIFPNKSESKLLYLAKLGGLIGEKANAGLCLGCGKCEKICPQKLPVSSHMRDVARTMEGHGFNFKVTVAKAAFRVYDGLSRLRHRGRKAPGQ